MLYVVSRVCLSCLLWLAVLSPVSPAATPLRREGVLTVAVYRDFAPFSQADNDSCTGVDVALARLLAKRLGLEPAMLPFNAGEDMADDLRNMVWRGDVLHYGPADLMMHVPVDPRFSTVNDQALIFAPYYRETLVLVRDKRVLAAVATPADLSGKFVAAEQGTAAASALLGAEGGALRERVRIVATPEDAMHLLLTGHVAAALVTRAQAEMALREGSDRANYVISKLTLNGIPPAGWAVGIAVKAQNTELAAQVAAALEAITRSGELQAIFEAQGLTLVNP